MEVLVLTKSDKNGGLCVAGIDMTNCSLVRLVSSIKFTHYAIPKWCMEKVNVLDIIDVSVVHDIPSFCQQENVEVQLQQWESIGKISEVELANMVNNDELFLFCDDCFYLDEAIAQNLNYSLMLVQVETLSISINEYNKTKATFYYNGKKYSNMSITDPEYYNKEGLIGNAILVISIPDIGYKSPYYDGKRCYKFIAKIYKM